MSSAKTEGQERSISAENIAQLIEDGVVVGVTVHGLGKHAPRPQAVREEFFAKQPKVDLQNKRTQNYEIILENFSESSSQETNSNQNDGFLTKAYLHIVTDYNHGYSFLKIKSSFHAPTANGVSIYFTSVLPGDDAHLALLLKGLKEAEDALIREWEKYNALMDDSRK